MPSPTKTAATIAAKTALSIVIIGTTFLVALMGGRWVGTVWGLRRAKQSGFMEFDQYRRQPRVSSQSDRYAHLWASMPRFPAYEKSAWHRMEVNNVTMYTGSMNVRGEPQEIVDYYIDQMSARGWHDVTEEFYNIDPYEESCSASKIVEQDPKALSRYERIRSHQAVLRRGGKSIMVHVRPRAKKRHKVDLTVAGTPDLRQFWSRTVDYYNRVVDEKSTRKWMRVVDGCADCRGGAVANFMVSGESPSELSARIIADLEKEGWTRNPMFSHVERGGTEGYLLTRGPHMTMVSAAHDHRVNRSTAMVIRMNE